ncbi:MAG: NAD(P)/FAD-dependent oxidoreductase [Lachnospiraceae bacterium]|nr:NAD(P)/FAD-dependent oxidoreductase [Lachnospiraceae bacterium]
MSKVIVAGGGAAGMMAAVTAALNGHEVILLEKNEKLGKKIYITGKGRCNVTNACDVDGLFKAVLSNPKFLYSAFYGFDNQATMQFFEECGCRLKVERGDRVFPVSDHASDVISALQRKLKELYVDIRLGTEVKALVADQTVKGVVLKNGNTLEADAVIVATGGLSYPTTGSTGDGYRFAKQTGHELVETRPSLVPFETKESWCKDLMGLALKNVTITLKKDGKELFKEFGEMLFTHFGVSGPLVLSASGVYVQKAWKERVQLYIDLKPALTIEQLDKRLLRDFEDNRNKQFKNALAGLFPTRLIPVMIQLSGIDPETKINEITKKQRLDFVQIIKNVPLTVIGCRDFAEAIITKGGVSVKDINPSTMESKKVKNLYFAGEVLDLDAVTGGFNLQIAWSTGYLAGNNIEWL